LEEIRFGPVVFIPGENSGRYPNCHSLYIEGKTKVLIDPGSNRERLVALKEGPGIDQIWLSHYHEDHIIYMDLFLDTELWMSEEDAPAMEKTETIIDFYGIDDEEEGALWETFLVEGFNYKPRKVDGRFGNKVNSNGEIDLGGVKVTVIPTPGHTLGNVSFLFEELGILFIGDYDLLKFGPWYGDRDSSIEETIESVNKLRDIPSKVWIASHGKNIYYSNPGELWDSFLSVIDKRESDLLEFLGEPRTMEDIVDARIIYKKELEPKLFYDFGERALMKKHLERLMKSGVVKGDSSERFFRV
jgi:hydroxyacylglutathione hydrolase